MSTRASDLLQLFASDSEIGIFAADALSTPTVAAHRSHAGAIFVYGFRECPNHHDLLASLTGGAIQRASSVIPASSDLIWTSGASVLSPHLAGLQLRVEPPSWFFVFELERGSQSACIETLALLDGKPWFLRVRAGEQWVYLLGIDDIPDAELIVPSAERELPLVSASIAILLFLRRHFPADVWVPGGAWGNFVIDDPLLRPRYGFVRHEQLAAHVNEAAGAATVAFIPWNARRSAQATIELYRRTNNLSICVHGYEHTADEFSTQDAQELRWRADSAMSAMHLHRELTGMDFEPVMAFPQGRFSAAAPEALSIAGFLAATNSTFLATDVKDVVRLKHLLEPAVTAYGALPLFRRRSPKYLRRFRYDCVLGKPLLLVEHHDYFKDEGEAFRQVFDAVRAIEPSIRWSPLGEIAREVHLLRVPDRGNRQVRFYCRQFCFRPHESGTYEFIKRENPAQVASVTVNGRPVEFTVTRDTLRFCATLEGIGVDNRVVVHAKKPPPAGKPNRRGESRFAVAARRYLSEVRDNYIDTNSQCRWCRSVVRSIILATRREDVGSTHA